MGPGSSRNVAREIPEMNAGSHVLSPEPANACVSILSENCCRRSSRESVAVDLSQGKAWVHWFID